MIPNRKLAKNPNILKLKMAILEPFCPRSLFSPKLAKKSQSKGFRGLGFPGAKNGQKLHKTGNLPKTPDFEAKNCHFGAILHRKPIFTKIGRKSQSKGFRGLGFPGAKNDQK